MPRKGYATITVREEVYQKLEEFAKRHKESVANVISLFAGYLDGEIDIETLKRTLETIKTNKAITIINTELLKRDLAQLYFIIDALHSILQSLIEERVEKRKLGLEKEIHPPVLNYIRGYLGADVSEEDVITLIFKAKQLKRLLSSILSKLSSSWLSEDEPLNLRRAITLPPEPEKLEFKGVALPLDKIGKVKPESLIPIPGKDTIAYLLRPQIEDALEIISKGESLAEKLQSEELRGEILSLFRKAKDFFSRIPTDYMTVEEYMRLLEEARRQQKTQA